MQISHFNSTYIRILLLNFTTTIIHTIYLTENQKRNGKRKKIAAIMLNMLRHTNNGYHLLLIQSKAHFKEGVQLKMENNKNVK